MERIQLRVPTSVSNKLYARAAFEDRSRNEVARRALEAVIDAWEEEPAFVLYLNELRRDGVYLGPPGLEPESSADPDDEAGDEGSGEDEDGEDEPEASDGEAGDDEETADEADPNEAAQEPGP